MRIEIDQVIAIARSIARGSYHGAGWGLDAGLIEFARFIQEASKADPIFDLLAEECQGYAYRNGFDLSYQDDLTEVLQSVGGGVAYRVGLPVNLEWRRMAERDRAVGHLAHYPEQPGRRPDSFGLRPEFQAGR